MNEAELVLSEILNCRRLDLYLNKDLPLGLEKSSLLSAIFRRRMQGEPLQYILKKTEFMGIEFKLNPNVFIPRPETEILVETALAYARSLPLDCRRILDLATGSGCIAVSLAKFLSSARITATDISPEALEVALDNALFNKVSDRIRFIQSDLFTSYELRVTSYDMIISNPPYIASSEIDHLAKEIQFEPKIALAAGPEGLDFYRRIIKESPGYLKAGGFLILEMGFGQSRSIEKMLANSGNFRKIEIIQDYNNIERVIVARKKA